ncbi:hypothetical protein FB561_7282 [Kribbella amoyensis]|uniref:Uncharacterized protein n=1 Tax=Kribbella amoyensis TaxID=996641 RepID=A0A561B3F3_9ACTN|nr:hypothetical protein [Kribbella amoyensis]TWD73393.1 hypothetical protein FB561_7282 [Kribbella amoyensis]
MTLPPTTVLPMGEIDPNTVRPGWVALLIVLALAAATALLWRNMGKQLKRIDFDPTGGRPAPADDTADDRAPSGDRPTADSSADQAGAAEPTAKPDAAAEETAAEKPADDPAHTQR